MSISTEIAENSLKKIWTDANSLTPTSVVTLFEIDITELALERGLNLNGADVQIFRFHNNLKLTTNNITFQRKVFIAAPIKAEGFETASKGVLANPKLTLTVDETGIQFLGLFKDRLRELGDLTGAKVTRIRTFAKYLDSINWGGETPDGFVPDRHAEFPRDVYYIDRKSNENKFSLEFELGSVLDVQGMTLPSRPVFAKRCPFQYRGEGCCYEFNSRRNSEIHGEAVLPATAIPVATENDELISNIIGTSNPIKVGEPYRPERLSRYGIGSSVYISKGGVNYYFVCKRDNPTKAPPDTNDWVADNCSRSIVGCRYRWGLGGAVGVGQSGLVKGNLPGGFFPAADKVG